MFRHLQKLCGSRMLNVNLSEKDLRQWNDSVPLAEGAHLFDSFYYKFLGKNEIKFIKEKKISASLFTKVKSSIIPMIIGNFNKEIILKKVNDLYPNYFIEASMITDYLYDSNLYDLSSNIVINSFTTCTEPFTASTKYTSLSYG